MWGYLSTHNSYIGAKIMAAKIVALVVLVALVAPYLIAFYAVLLGYSISAQASDALSTGFMPISIIVIIIAMLIFISWDDL